MKFLRQDYFEKYLKIYLHFSEYLFSRGITILFYIVFTITVFFHAVFTITILFHIVFTIQVLFDKCFGLKYIWKYFILITGCSNISINCRVASQTTKFWQCCWLNCEGITPPAVTAWVRKWHTCIHVSVFTRYRTSCSQIWNIPIATLLTGDDRSHI